MNEFAPPDDLPEKPPAVQVREPTQQTAEPNAEQADLMRRRKWLFRFVVAIGLFVVTLIVKMQKKDATNLDVKQKAYAAFAEYEDQALIRRLIDKHHAQCFEEAFSLGRRNQSSKFDQQVYINCLRTAIHMDLAWESGSMQQAIHDATFGKQGDPIRLPDELMNPPKDALDQLLPPAEEEKPEEADLLQLPPKLNR